MKKHITHQKPQLTDQQTLFGSFFEEFVCALHQVLTFYLNMVMLSFAVSSKLNDFFFSSNLDTSSTG